VRPIPIGGKGGHKVHKLDYKVICIQKGSSERDEGERPLFIKEKERREKGRGKNAGRGGGFILVSRGTKKNV